MITLRKCAGIACGLEFIPRDRNKRQRFCSRHCRTTFILAESAAESLARRSIERSCAWCRIAFTAKTHSSEKFCTRYCSRRFHDRKQKDRIKQEHNMLPRMCKQCGASFAFVHGLTRKFYCSSSCATDNSNARRLKPKLIKQCDAKCGASFPSSKLSERRFCSLRCYYVVRNARFNHKLRCEALENPAATFARKVRSKLTEGYKRTRARQNRVRDNVNVALELGIIVHRPKTATDKNAVSDAIDAMIKEEKARGL